MNSCSLYFDEDSSNSDLVFALRQRGISVLTAAEAGRKRAKDEDHLVYAASVGRVIYTFNVSDYCALHKEFMATGRNHAGIIIGAQQRFSVGEQLRRLLRLRMKLSSESMVNRVEFLSNW